MDRLLYDIIRLSCRNLRTLIRIAVESIITRKKIYLIITDFEKLKTAMCRKYLLHGEIS